MTKVILPKSKVTKVKAEDGRDVFVKVITGKYSTQVGIIANTAIADDADEKLEAMAEIIKACVVMEDGSPVPELEELSAEDLAQMLPVSELLILMAAIAEGQPKLGKSPATGKRK